MASARQRGYALVEIALALLIASLLAALGAQVFVHRFNDAEAQAAAVWMGAVHKAVQTYVRRHGPDIQASENSAALFVDGYANWSSPEMSELENAGLLSKGFPVSTRLTGAARILVWRRGDCPGEFCKVEALVHSERPLRHKTPDGPDEGMIAQWLLATQGQGGAVQASDPGRIHGAAFSIDAMLPDGSELPVGTVGMAVTAEHLALWDFLRVRDTRDPDFQNDMNVAGDIRSRRNVNAGRHLVIGAHHDDGEYCDPGDDNAVAHEAMGGLLVCRDGIWRSSSRTGGGGYSFHTVYGCRTKDGASTANPITGSCSCPWYTTSVRILDVELQTAPEVRQRAYLCVG